MGILSDIAEHESVDKTKLKNTVIGLASGKKGYEIDGVSENTVSRYRKILGKYTRSDIIQMMADISQAELKSSLRTSEVK